MNPLLDPLSHPDFPALTPAAIGPALEEALAHHRAVVSDIVARRPTSFAEAWLPFERAETIIDSLWSAVTHLSGVADTPELRAAEAAGKVLVVENALEVEQNRDLFEVFSALAASPEMAAGDPADRAALAHAIRGFTLSGVALEPAARDRFRAISVELAELGTGFSNAVLDATEAWTEHVTDEALLAGITQADRAMLASAAGDAGLEGWLISLRQPSVQAVLRFGEDRELRRRVYEAFGTRASDEGPHAGRFDNSDRIQRIVTLRQEAAALLGFADPVERSLATKMAPGGAEVLAFLRDLAARARPAAKRDLADLRAFAAAELGIADLQPWDIAFASERLRATRHALNEEEVRGYFPVGRVLAGWQDLLRQLFGVTLQRRDDVPLPHPDAMYYDVLEQDGRLVAGVYVDLHARAGKRGGAWMSGMRPRLADGNAVRVPVATLNCNWAPDGGAMPALLSHNDIVTLLHETGHALHGMLTAVNRPSIAGTSGFEWDAIELPSQLLEDFAWDRAVLTGMSGHYRTGETLPAELFDRMAAARNFQTGLALLRQIEFGLFDLLLHGGTLGTDPVEVLAAVREEIAVLHPPAWHRFPHAFTHIFSGGYAAGYYSYLWAEVLAADGFARFAEAGLVDRATGDLFRAEVLARGAARPAADSFRAFRGRDAEPAAMLARYGLLPEPA
ncbi:oligopeptidase A [Croceibacterium mercuriale]|uniref:oligopeptidase A n=1 Tax=Croceibacterium mercuriale TaxID=1572751 RepID=A0A0B2BXW3_9SPHN|nr:M3 family metallopeptidase [Croceibacterium mercuriale]KHL24675.1 oligopeptidase A [Croceibacterium mercuriale]